MNHKDIYTKEQAELHLKNHNILVDEYKKLISQCIDGRYLSQDNEAVSIPGADVGELQVMMVTLKQLIQDKTLSHDDIKILEKILIDTVGGIENLRFHTDDHNHGHGGIGCGHLRLGHEDPNEYHLSKDEMHMVSDFMERSIAEGAKNVVLQGHHGEKAVFIIDSASHSLHSQDVDGNQVFIYHKTFAEQRNLLIAEKMKQEIPELIENADIDVNAIAKTLNTIMEKHLNSTSMKLAKGLPIYKISIDHEKKEVQHIGIIE